MVKSGTVNTRATSGGEATPETPVRLLDLLRDGRSRGSAGAAP
jgi:hypothetical protein